MRNKERKQRAKGGDEAKIRREKVKGKEQRQENFKINCSKYLRSNYLVTDTTQGSRENVVRKSYPGFGTHGAYNPAAEKDLHQTTTQRNVKLKG